MDFYGLSGLPTAPTIDPLAHVPTEEEQIAARAAAENAAIQQEAEMHQARARLDAEAATAAKANQQIQAEAEAARAAAAPSGIGDYAGEAIRSGAEGVQGLWDLPEIGYNAIVNNLPRRIFNMGAFEPQPLVEPYTPVRDEFNRQHPVTPGWEKSWTRTIGNIAGPAIVAAPLSAAGAPAAAAEAGAGARALALAKTAVVTPAVTTGLGVAGSLAGDKLGEWGAQALAAMKGGPVNPAVLDALKTWGSFAGGAAANATPGAAVTGLYRSLHRALTDASSAARFAANRRIGVRSSMGNVGNRRAKLMEGRTANVAFGGNRAYDVHREQYTALEQAVLARANAARAAVGAPEVTPGHPIDISAGSIGAGATDAAIQARRVIQGEVNRQFGQGLSEVVGRDTVLDPISQNQRLEALAADPTTDVSQRPTIRRAQRDMAANSRDQVVDPALENVLQSRKASILAQAPNHDPIALEQVNAQIDANRGPTWQQQLTQRAITRDARGRPLDARMQEEINAAQTETLQQAAEAAGISPAEFERINTETARLKQQQADIKRLTGPRPGQEPTEGSALTAMFGSGGQRNLRQQAALMEHAPGPTTAVVANEMERRMRGDVSAGQAESNPETFNPVTAASWLDKQEPGVRDILAPTPADQSQLDALATALRAEVGRPSITAPNKSASGLQATSDALKNPLTLLSLASMFGSGYLGHTGIATGAGFAAALAAAFPALRARIIANRFTNPNFVQKVVHPPGYGQTLDLPRILAGAAASGNSQPR